MGCSGADDPALGGAAGGDGADVSFVPARQLEPMEHWSPVQQPTPSPKYRWGAGKIIFPGLFS